MDVSHTEHSHVIGKGGNNIRKVMQDTGCHIHFPDSNRGNNLQEKSNQVSIAGLANGVENARIRIRELLPLVFIVELPSNSSVISSLESTSACIQHIQQTYGVSISVRQHQNTSLVTIMIRGSVYACTNIKDATTAIVKFMTGSAETNIHVSVQLEIAPQHHMFMFGRAGVNMKQIMQQTGAVIHAADPGIMATQKKGTIYLSGSMNSVLLARQHLIGCLPLVLMFDVKDKLDFDQANISLLMEHLDVFISIKPKPKQTSKSVIIKSIERNVSNMYIVRNVILNSTNYGLRIDNVFSGCHKQNATFECVNPNVSNMNVANTFFLLGEQSPPATVSPTMSSWIPSYHQSSILSPVVVMNPPNYALNNFSIATDALKRSSQSLSNLPYELGIKHVVPCVRKDYISTSGHQNLDRCNPHNIGETSVGHSQSQDCPMFASQSSVADESLPKPPLLPGPSMIIGYHDPLRLCGQTTVAQSTFPNNNDVPMNLLNFNDKYSNLDSSQSLFTYMERQPYLQTDVGDPLKPLNGFNESLLNLEDKDPCPSLFSQYGIFPIDYEEKKLLATKAMQKKPEGESRTPTDIWSGLGFSKSMPDSVIREKIAQNSLSMTLEDDDATPLHCNGTDVTEVLDCDSWGKSFVNKAPINLAPGEYPSPRKKASDCGLSCSSYVESGLFSQKLPHLNDNADLAELFSKMGLGKYTDLFHQQEIDFSMFLTLNDVDLKELGISTFGARRKMLLAIADMTKRDLLFPDSEAPSKKNSDSTKHFPPTLSSQPVIGSSNGRW